MSTAIDDTGPIAGVSLADFVAVSLELARVQFDAARSPEVAVDLGISAAAWAEASTGWQERLRANPGVAEEFARRYRRGLGAH